MAMEAVMIIVKSGEEISRMAWHVLPTLTIAGISDISMSMAVEYYQGG